VKAKGRPVERDALALAVLTQLGEPGARCVHARDGREHHLFRVTLARGDRMLKVPRADAIADPFDSARTPLDRLLAEEIAVREARGVPVPQDYRVHPTEPPCATMTVLPGMTAEQAYERGQLDADGLLRVCLQMGRTLAGLHSVRRTGDGGRLPDLEVTDAGNARLLHLDYHLGNVLGRPKIGVGWEITGVVDWTCARWGPPEADFVEMQVSVFIRNPRARDAFVAGYRQVAARAVNLAEVERRAAAEVRRRLEDDPDEGGTTRGYWEAFAEKHKGG